MQRVQEADDKSAWHSKSGSFNLVKFFYDNRATLPIHFRVFVADVGCKKLTSSNVETVFSGAGYMTKKATTISDELLTMYVFVFYNMQYEWLMPSTEEIVTAYINDLGEEEVMDDSDGSDDSDDDLDDDDLDDDEDDEEEDDDFA